MTARLRALAFAAGAGALLLSAPFVRSANAGDPPRLAMPVACDVGRTCFVQNYVDLDPGTGTLDHACGAATYDGHSGTDIRVLSAEAARAGVPVLAASPGIVKGARDGVADIFVRDGGRDGIQGRECGNGVVIDHGQGWETQYCHMRQGSVKVAKGQRVERGSHIGDVGWSGLADFAHLHFEVRKDGRVIDPFTGRSQDAACNRDRAAIPPGVLWTLEAQRLLPYRDGELIEAGFAASPLSTEGLERGGKAVPPPGATAPSLVFYARLINGRAGDRIRLVVAGPDAFNVETSGEALDRARATWVSFAGRRLRAARWPAGRYEGRAELVRGGAVVATRSAVLELQ